MKEMVHPPRTNVADYLEERLGSIDYGWSDPSSNIGVQVVRFKDQPESNVNTLATLGLSDKQLAMRRSGRNVRQELLLCGAAANPAHDAVSLLLSSAERCEQRGEALLRGEILMQGGPSSVKNE